MTLRLLSSTTLGDRPLAINNLNGGSFQSDALRTRKGFQYVVFYRDAPSKGAGVRQVCIGRRDLAHPESSWEVLEFEDYEQTEDDGHNTISLGICSSDGSIHMSFDNHDTPLVYRKSMVDLTTSPRDATWSTSSFSEILNVLPGLEGVERSYFENITYPRFLSLPSGGLALEYRVGISGLGDDLLFVYSEDESGRCSWKEKGVYLEGVENNAYINGLDVDHEGKLHVSWTYRDFVPVTLEESRQQAGPNGPENNHDLLYASTSTALDSPQPLRWVTSDGTELGDGPLLPSTERIMAFDIPKCSGILNQEAQTLDSQGGFHVLNREFNVQKVQVWMHYHLSPPPEHVWSRSSIPAPCLPPSLTSSRGKIVALPKSKGGGVLLLLPMQLDLVILKAGGSAFEYKEVMRIRGAGGRENEVLFDRSRSSGPEADGVLSLFFGGFLEEGKEGKRVVKVVDLEIV